MKRHTKKIIRTILLLLMPLFLIGLNASSEQTTKADSQRADPKAPFTPSDPPKKTLGIWTKSGYNLQPQADYYIVLGDEVTLRTNVVRSAGGSLVGLGDSPHYRWWQKGANDKWALVPKDNNGQKKNFTVEPQTEGDFTYQLDTQYYKLGLGWMGIKTHFFSIQSTVHVSPEPVEALDLEVTVDDDYLYYSDPKSDEPNITNAHAVPTPINATGQITWSISDTSLATIDDDGQITSNSTGKSGIVWATASMSNYEMEDIHKSVRVEIGGGLDDQEVKSGETADFTLKGNTFDDADDNEDIDSIDISWKKFPAGTDTNNGTIAPNNVNDATYTTPPTTMDDDQTRYQATITLTKGKDKKEIKSNLATLTVIPAGDPEMEITNTIKNNSYTTDKDTVNFLNDVIGTDNVVYRDTLTNKSSEGILKDGSYVIPMIPGTQINHVKIDGDTIDPVNYTQIFDEETNSDDLVIKIGNIATTTSMDIEVDTTVPDITQKQSFRFTPYVHGTDNDGNIYRQEGTEEDINYITDKIDMDVEDIDFGTITAFSKGVLKYRPEELNNPNNIANIDDQRRDKAAVKVFVTQTADLVNDQEYVLPATIRYYENGNHEPILNNKVKISETTLGNQLNSIAWDKSDGLLLHIDDDHLPAGKYTTTLTWTCENTI